MDKLPLNSNIITMQFIDSSNTILDPQPIDANSGFILTNRFRLNKIDQDLKRSFFLFIFMV